MLPTNANPPLWRIWSFIKTNPKFHFSGVLFYWLLFIIFNLYTWEKTELFNPAWWRDTASHAFLGLTLPLSIIYVYSAHTLKGAVRLENTEKREAFLAKTNWKTAVVAIVWECFELGYDFYILPGWKEFLIEAQKGSADTTIDIAATVLMAYITTKSFNGYKNWARKKRPYDHVLMARKIAEWEELTEELFSDVKNMRREDRRQIRPLIKRMARTLRKPRVE